MNIKLFLLWLFCFALSGCNQALQTASDLSGKKIYFPDPHYQITLINYWASWCEFCQQEVSELNKFSEKNQPNHIRLVGVNFDEMSPSDLKKLLPQMHIHFPVLTQNPDLIFNKEKVQGLPTTVVLNDKDEIITVLTGPQTVASLEAAIKSYRHS